LSDASPVMLTGLDPFTLYTVTVTSNCGEDTVAVTTTFRTAIGNDDCEGATVLVAGAPGADCTPLTYSLSGATASGITSPCTPVGSSDVFFSFVATSPQHTIVVVPTFDFNAVIELRDGSCEGASIQCQNASSSGGGPGTETMVANGLTVGQSYLIRVYNTIAAPASFNFNICITTPADEPCDAVADAQVTTSFPNAQLTFTEVDGAESYFVQLAPSSGGSPASGTFDAGPVDMSNLIPDTEYTLTIITNCENGGISEPVVITFTSESDPFAP